MLTDLERNPGKPKCSYASHGDFYAEAQVDLNVLTACNQFRPRNEITLQQLDLLTDSFKRLEELHRGADNQNTCLSLEEIEALRAGFDSSFGAVLKLELANRRGDKNNQ